MVKWNISFYKKKKKEIVTKTWTLYERKISYYEFFGWRKHSLILWISGSKRGSFPTQEVGGKIFS